MTGKLKIVPLLFLAPALAVMASLVFYPLLKGIYYSFTNINQYNMERPEYDPTQLSEQQTTITFWHTHNVEESETINEMISEFERLNPQIRIEKQRIPFSDAQNKYKTVAQAGDAPDVFRAEIAWTAEFGELGFLRPLDDLMPPDGQADFLRAPLTYCRYKDKLWGVPQVTDCLALLYNKRILAADSLSPPGTMDEFVAVSQKLRDRAADRYGFFYRGDSYFFLPFIWAFGGDLIDGRTRQVLINRPESVQALQFLLDLRDKYQVVPKNIDFANDYDNMMVGFKTGKFAMILNGPWATADILSGREFSDPANLGVTRIPMGPKGDYGSPVGGHNYVIAANCKHVRASWQFIEFMNSTENQVKFALTNNLLPTRKSAYQEPSVAGNEILQGFRYQLEVANNRPVIPESGLIFTDLTPAFQAALSGTITPKQAIEQVAEKWEKLLGYLGPEASIIGVSNYIEILSGAEFWLIFWQTIIWTFCNVFFHFTIGLGLALLINAKIKGRSIYRIILLLPWAVPTYISAFSWRWLFNQDYGFFNLFLKSMGAEPLPWLSDPFWAMVAVIATNIWLGFPFMMVVFLGGLQSIPEELYEALQIDGGNKLHEFRYVTLPMLKPVTLTATLLGAIWTFNMFNIIYLVTKGGPFHRTDILATFAYIQAFENWNFGLATTYAVIILSLLTVFSYFYIKVGGDSNPAK